MTGPSKPTVAVIIATCQRVATDGRPAYSDTEWLPNAIRSVHEQTVVGSGQARVRVIVVDCSPAERHVERTAELGLWKGDAIVRVRPSAVSRDPGVCEAIMRGVYEAGEACDWVVPLNADDELAPRFVEECLWFAEYTRMPLDHRTEIVLLSDQPLSEAILRDNYITYCCMARRQFWLSYGFHRELPSEISDPTDPLADWGMWMRLFTITTRTGWEHCAVIAPPSLLKRRERSDSASRWSSERFERMRAELWQKHGVAPCV